jgi:hypothetical protein
MTFRAGRRYHAGGYHHRRLSRDARPQRFLGGAALASVTLLCAWTICANHGGPTAEPFVAVQPTPPRTASDSFLVHFDFRPLFDSRPLFDTRFAWAFSPETFSQRAAPQGSDASTTTASIPSQTTVAQTVASPPPQIRLPPIRAASLHDSIHAIRAVASAEATTIFEKLFGKPGAVTLAYAAPDDANLGGAHSTGLYDRSTAVYDISARKVYMPDGTTLEAHSGYGDLLDDPRHPEARDRGVTPPNVYDLAPRETLFHGVRALRLIPVDDGKVFGRSGFLAHTYMLGPNGDSNGCVSFKDYDTFLAAYLNHEITRLAVVSRVD